MLPILLSIEIHDYEAFLVSAEVECNDRQGGQKYSD